MAVRGTFIGDFSKFNDAVRGAGLTLKSFESDSAKVETQLNRMGNAFSGQKTLQQATLMAASVQKLGGVSGLTKTELARVASTMDEAIAKAKAMGLEIPPEVAKVSAEARRAQVGFREMATAGAAIGAIVAGAAAGIAKLGERGAGVNDVRDSFRDLTTQIGETSDAILGRLREATLGTISDTELMKTANLGLSQGLQLTAEQFGTTGDVAAVLADRIGGDVKTSFDTLVQAMATGQDRTLKTIGLNIDAARATEQYAASLGKTAAQLTEEERKTAIKNAILAEGQRILQASGKAQEDFGDKVAQSSTKLSNFVDKVGSWIATSPSIGAWTSTITAASSTVTAFGLAFGPVSAGVSKLLPLLGLSGIGGAFASLGTILTGTVIPALGTALAAVLPFALPLAALATAIGVVYLAWQNWDKITGIVRAVYEGVKTWLGDKLQGVVDSVKRKVEAVTGFFSGMYDQLVGHSIVPDTIAGIEENFAMLDGVMVGPTEAATGRVAELFGALPTAVSASVGEMVGLIQTQFTQQLPPAMVEPTEQATMTVQTLWDALLANAKSTFDQMPAIIADPMGVGKNKAIEILGQLKTDAEKLIGDTVSGIGSRLNGLVTSIIPKWGSGLSGAMGSIASGAMGIFSNLLTGGISSVLSVAGSLLMKGLGKIGSAIGNFFKGVFGGGVIGTVVNPARDQWFAGRGVQDIGDELGKFGIDGNQAASMIKAVFDSKSMDELKRTTEAIDKILRGGAGVPDVPEFNAGTGNRYVDFGPGTLAMLHGKEKITPLGSEDNSGRPIAVTVMLDGREIAWALVPHLPDAQAALA